MESNVLEACCILRVPKVLFLYSPVQGRGMVTGGEKRGHRDSSNLAILEETSTCSLFPEQLEC